MNYLAGISLKNRALILLITLAALIFGALATTSAKRELMPSIEVPQVMVSADYQGASPKVVQDEVTEPLEQAVKGVSGVTTYSSTSSDGSAQITAEFDYGDNSDDMAREVRQAVDQAEGQLPDDVDPEVNSFGSDDIPVVMLAAGSGDGDAQKLAQPLEDKVVPELESIDGVRGAQVTGVRDSSVDITLDEDDLEDEDLTKDDVSSTLQSSGLLTPGGDIDEDGKNLTVTTGGKLESVKAVKNLWLKPGSGGGAAGAQAPSGGGGQPGGGQPGGASPQGGGAQGGGAPSAGAGAPSAGSQGGGGGGDPVQLKDVADVKLKPDSASSITRTDGKPSLGIMVTKTPEGNTVDISDAVQAKLGDLKPLLGADADISVVFDQAPFINDSITAMGEEGALGLAFAVAVILVFLLSVRSTLVTAVSIPVSLLVGMIGVQAFGYSLNMLTLGALTVAVGRVVDDSIVVLENIKRHLSYGEDKFTAVYTGVREVATAITAATLTTVAVFLPIALVGGQAGELFSPFAVTVSLALGASLLVSLTIIPVLAYWFMRPKLVPPEDLERVKAEQARRELRTPLQRAYLPVIRWCTRHRVITLAASVLVLIGTFALYPQLKTDFLGQEGQNTYAATQELPPGTSLKVADKEAQKVEDALDDLPWIESQQSSISSSGGGGGDDGGMAAMMGGGGTSTTQYTITTDPDGDQEKYRKEIRRALADVETTSDVRLQDAAGGGAGGQGLEVDVKADDQQTLRKAAGEVEDAVGDIPGAADVENSISEAQPGLDVDVDKEEAAEEGLTEGQIGQAVTDAFEGSEVGTATIDDVQHDIVVRSDDRPDSTDDLRDLKIDTPDGDEIKLTKVADVTRVNEPPELNRSDGVNTATISASPTASDLGAVTTELQQKLDTLDLPEGATASIGGVSDDQAEANSQLGIAMLAAVAIVFLIMVATFKSLIQPLILLVSIPFAATGSLGLLLLSDVPLGLPAMIGLLMLIGIVVTNAIVLIDLVNQYRDQGVELREAVVEGCRHRLRPILMTALATIGALTPMALGITGGGAFISQPLAIVVIGGLITSTLLTLVLVPVLYTMAEARKERRAQRKAAKREAKLARARERAAGGTEAGTDADQQWEEHEVSPSSGH